MAFNQKGFSGIFGKELQHRIPHISKCADLVAGNRRLPCLESQVTDLEAANGVKSTGGMLDLFQGVNPADRSWARTPGPEPVPGRPATAFDFTISRTVPDFIPNARLTTTLLLYQGKVRLCNLSGRCVDVVDACNFGAFNSAGAVAIQNEQETRVALRNLFPFAANQNPLLTQFRVANARQCVVPTLVAPGGSPGLVTGGPGGFDPPQTDPAPDPDPSPDPDPPSDPDRPPPPPPCTSC